MASSYETPHAHDETILSCVHNSTILEKEDTHVPQDLRPAGRAADEPRARQHQHHHDRLGGDRLPRHLRGVRGVVDHDRHRLLRQQHRQGLHPLRRRPRRAVHPVRLRLRHLAVRRQRRALRQAARVRRLRPRYRHDLLPDPQGSEGVRDRVGRRDGAGGAERGHFGRPQARQQVGDRRVHFSDERNRKVPAVGRYVRRAAAAQGGEARPRRLTPVQDPAQAARLHRRVQGSVRLDVVPDRTAEQPQGAVGDLQADRDEASLRSLRDHGLGCSPPVS